MTAEVIDLTDSPEPPLCKRARVAAQPSTAAANSDTDDEVQIIISPSFEAVTPTATVQQGSTADGHDDDLIVTGA